MISFHKESRTIEHGNRVIIGNLKNGQWIKLSKECYQALKQGMDLGLTEEQFINCLEDPDDQNYFKQLFEKLRYIDILAPQGKPPQNNSRWKHIYFAITNRCNLSCIHCCYNAKSGAGADGMTTDELFSVIDKIVQCSPEIVTISGGEPMLRKDFFEILAYTRQRYEGKLTLSTNGTLIHSRNVRILARLIDSIDISLDGVDEASCAYIRGPGVFDKVTESVRLLQKEGFYKISLSMVSVDQNKHLEEQFHLLNKELGTRAIVRHFSPIGRGYIQKDHLSPFHEIQDFETATGRFDLEFLQSAASMCTCGAGKKEILIDYDGSIYPCGLLIQDRYKLCSVHELETLRHEVFERSCASYSGTKHLDELWPDHSKCKDCKVNLFCWSCLQHMDMLKDDEEAFNRRCKSRKKQLYSIIWSEPEPVPQIIR
ncbi:radical SAM/SPASM domain-containing protein [Paenibacillus oleatilyticus]|uniref:radical SAM/SPASM domain-containing protein n=1 Tax=Paenibacillus oleatilyticus TaxID=2594886 RepID=UPI001C20068B|nr:radical SAM protein [Paenibacillus oleatilyticus]MBU7318320.1 radical SAM protein [Paenibacillus oleatilyticus]